MAETLTYDPTPADQPELNEEEQKSLEVGEKLAEQEGELLAGKYKDAQELESAYLELQKKLGSNDDSTEAKDNSIESKDDEVKPEDDSKFYLEDGKVNYEEVNNLYGDKLGEIFKNSDLDPFAISKHFHENQGEITPEMKQSLIDTGLSEAAVDSYLAGRAAEAGYNSPGIEDLTDKQVSTIQDSVGGAEEYRNLMNWSQQNVSQSEADAFDSIVNTGNPDAIQLLVTGLKARYDEVNGYEGRMLTGKTAQANTDAFRSQAEVVQAMNDPRYDNDPAYRQDIYEKLERSNVKF